MAVGGRFQDTERNRLSEGHSQTGDGTGRLVRTQKEIDHARGTHKLETTGAEICQDTERNRPSEGHSQTRDGREGETCQDTERNRMSKGLSRSGDGRGRNLSGHGKKPTE